MRSCGCLVLTRHVYDCDQIPDSHPSAPKFPEAGPGGGYTKNRHSRVQKEFINPLPLVGDQFGGSFCTQTASIRETAEPHYGGKNCY